MAAAPPRTLAVEVTSLVGLKHAGRTLGDVLGATPKLEGVRPYATLTLGPLSTSLPLVTESTGPTRWTASFQYWNETEVRLRVLHQNAERRAVQFDPILGEAALLLDPASLDNRPVVRSLDLALGGDAHCGKAELRYRLSEAGAGAGEGAAAAPQAPPAVPLAGPDAGGGGAAAPPVREGFRFRVSGLGALPEADVTQHFSRYGEVLGVDFARDPRTGDPAGKASIRLCGFDGNAKNAVFNDPHLVGGYKLTVTDDCERKLFIGGFKDTPAEVVRDHFALFGELEEFDAAVRDQSGKPRGYAFVRFIRQEDVDRVLAQPEHQINGRTCTVRKAEARPVPLPKGSEAEGKKKSGAQRSSASRSRSGDGRRRARGGIRGRTGGLQVAPGYEYKDGVGAQPSMGYHPPGDRPFPWGPPPPHYGYPPYGMPPPPHYGYGYGYPPPGAYGAPPGYGAPAGYGPPPPQGWPPPPASQHGGAGMPGEGPSCGFDPGSPQHQASLPAGSGSYVPPVRQTYGGYAPYGPPPHEPGPGPGAASAGYGGGGPPAGYYSAPPGHGGSPPASYSSYYR